MFTLKNFGKAFGIGSLIMIGLIMIALIASMFLVSRNQSPKTMGWGKGMMYNAPLSMGGSPAMTGETFDTASPSDKSIFRGGMMDRAAGVPDMMETQRQVIKTGTLQAQVQNVDETVSRVTKIAEEMGGNVADSQFSRLFSGMKSGTITVKVPVQRFQEAFTQLKGVATVVVSENMSGTDVTAEFIDLQARINNKKAAEATLQTLFERAVKISDVIEITDKLAVVRSEIESLEGQIRYLGSQARMASITLMLTEDVTVAPSQGFRPVQTIKESLSVLIQMAGNLVQGLIQLVVVGLPVLLLYGVILWLVYRVALRIVRGFWPGSLPEKRGVVRRK